MTDFSSRTGGHPHPLLWLVWLAIFAGLPATVAWRESPGRVAPGEGTAQVGRAARPPSPPPPVEPLKIYALEPQEARAFNAAIPFSRLPNPAARPFLFSGDENDLARAIDCLAAAQIYEAGDDAVGEQAVAQVVLNRVRHPAFPKTVCGVVFQGQERTTGCQFTFTCDGALGRTPSPAAWARARDIAVAALAGKIFRPVGLATHYHTDWVVPYWSSSLDKVAAVGTHLFFRWTGWWGTPPAFRRTVDGSEPLIARIARLSVAHRGAPDAPLVPPPALATTQTGAALLAAKPQQAVGTDSLDQNFGGSRLIAIAPGARTFLFELGRGTTPESWPSLAQTFCAGRPECRIMGWRAGLAPPNALPLSTAQIDAMAFAYIHNATTGLQRALWNCALTPRPDKRDCMRERDPITVAPPPQPGAVPQLSGVRRKDRFETVTIAKPPAVAPTAAPPKE
jgi:hypothetical protein